MSGRLAVVGLGPGDARYLTPEAQAALAAADALYGYAPYLARVPERADAVLRTGVSAWLVSARGRVVASVARGRYPALPRIWLPPGVQIKPGAFLAGDAGAAARALRSFVSAGFSRRALWARIRDGQLTVALRSGLELRFGNATDVALKLAVAQNILTTLPPPRAGGPQYLDVSVPERPVAGSDSQVGG